MPSGLDTPSLIGGRFAVEAIAGSGALGVIYRCRDLNTGGLVAVKVAPHATAKVRECFMQEAEMLATVDHPHVVRYVAHGLLDDREGLPSPWLAMEWLEGEDLHARLERAPLAVEEILELARQMASALAAAHAIGIVHRDVKPANVFLVGKDPTQPKLIDFGIGFMRGRGAGQARVLGTPGYMAPEQARGEELIDARADVFALGCVLYECAAGRRAFEGDSPMAVLARVLLEEPPPPGQLRADLPPAFERLIVRMLSKSKDARHGSAIEVARDLQRLDVLEAATDTPAALGTRERKLLCLLVARRGQAPSADATLVDDAIEPTQAVRELTASLGTEAEVLLDGSIVVAVDSSLAGTTAIDQASRTARAALRLRAVGNEKKMGMRVAIATGRGEMSGAVPFGEVVDRACALLDTASDDRGVSVDALTSSLLEGRFQLEGATLLGELDSGSVRSLLGRTTGFVGRERELATLLGLYEKVTRARMPRLAIVTGEAGMGKSRLRAELAARLEKTGAGPLWLLGGGEVGQPGAPFGAIQTALRRELALRPGQPRDERHALIVNRLSQGMSEVDAQEAAPLLAQLAGLPIDDPGPRLLAGRADPTIMGDLLRGVWQDYLEAEGHRRTVIVALEDMEWGDRPSVTLMLGALNTLRSTPLLVLITARPDVVTVFPELASVQAERVELLPLAPEAARRFVAELLPADTSGERIERVVQQAAGNVFVLEELARAVAQGRDKELPETVLANAQARLDALSPSLRRVLRAGAVLGEALTEDGLRALLGDLDEAVRAESLRELVRDDVILRDPGDPKRYRFRQAIIREASYASLTEADKRLAHALAAAHLTARGGADALTLATHLERAGRPEDACAHFVTAAEQSLEGQDLEGAHSRLMRAIACGARGPMLGRVQFLLSEVDRWRGDYVAMRNASVEATKLLPDGGMEWLQAKGNEAIAAGQLGDVGPSQSLALLLAVLLEGGDVTPTVVTEGARIAATLTRFRVVEASNRLLAALERAAPSCKDARAVGRVWDALATDASFRDDLEEAVTLYDRACDCYLRASDVRNRLFSHINQGFALTELGQYRRANDIFREMLRVADRYGLRPARALVLHNLGMSLAAAGEVGEGAAAEREAIEMYREQKNKRLIAASQHYLGRMLLASGDLDGASAAVQTACADAEALPSLLPAMLAGRALVELARGRPKEALATARDAMKRTVEREGRVELGRVVKLALAETCAACGERAEATRLVAELVAEIEGHASRLRDPQLRRSFVEDVHDHARAFALHASLRGPG